MSRNTSTTLPPRLKQGDAVALIAPASGQKRGDEHYIQQAQDILARWGLSVIQPPQLMPQHYLSADDDCRAAALQQALRHPDIKAIFVTRGGYGCARLLPLLQNIVIPSPRWLLGFSDMTTLHLHFADKKNLTCVHAPNLATQTFLTDSPAAQRSRYALHDLLFSHKASALLPTPLFASAVSVDLPNAPMTGGCLSLLVTSLATAHEIQTRGKILMIEEIGEAPYKIDRMLTHLKNAGKFDDVAAVVFGELTRCDSKTISAHAVIKTLLADLKAPVYSSPTFGHGELNLPWVYG